MKTLKRGNTETLKDDYVRLILITSFMLAAAAASSWAQPLPHPANPQILSIVQQISSDTLLATITRLTQFHTRHTFSDTTSDSTGVGAAVRWVQTKGESYDSGNQIDWEEFPWVGYFNGNPLTRNVLIARVAGAAGDEARYIIGGHLDSRTANLNDNTGLAPGADDNGSTCAATLEMLRLLPDSLAHRLEVIWFTGEEQGLLGSAAYAQYLSQQGGRVDGMLGLDMIGHIVSSGGQVDSSSLRMYAQGPPESLSRGLQRYLKWVGEAYAEQDTFEMRIIPATDRPGRGGDHMSFSARGYPAVRVMETNEDVAFQHNPNDLPQNLSSRYARHVAMCAYGGLLTMLLAPARPPAPEVTNVNGTLEITIPDSVVLPPGGLFYLGMRRTTDNYYRWITDLDTLRYLAYLPDTANVTYAFALSRADSNDRPSPFSSEATIHVLAAEEPRTLLPFAMGLAASPNPFNGEVTFTLEVAQASQSTLEIYDLLGRRVATAVNEVLEAGTHRREWSPSNFAGGIYLARFQTAKGVSTLKIVYLK